MRIVSEAAKWRIAAVAVIVPIAAVAATLIWQDYESRRDALITNLELKSAQINAQLEDFVNTTEAVTTQLAASVSDLYPGLHVALEDSAQPGSASRFLARFLEMNAAYSRALVADRTGTILAASDAAAVGTRVPAQRFFDSVSSSNGYVVSDVFVPPDGSPPNAMFAYPVRGPSGIPTGYLLLKTELSTITAALDMSVGFPTSAKSGIFDSNGVVLAGTGYEAPHPGMAAGKDISASAVWAQAATRPAEAWFGPGLDKVERIIFFDYPEKTPWITTVAFAQSELFDPLWTRVYAFSAGLGLTLIGTLALISILRRREGRAWSQATAERQTLKSVIEGATDGILVIDSTGRVVYANTRFGEMLQLGSAMHAGADARYLAADLKDRDAVTGDDEKTLAALIEQGDGPRMGVIAVAATPPLPKLEVEITAYPIRKWDGEPAGQTLVVHDVTEETRLQRMKSEFVAHASHQLRTPLASILASAELLIGAGDESQETREKWVSLVYSQALRMRSTISTLLNLSQLESGRITLDNSVVDLRSVVKPIADEFGAHSTSHSISVDIADAARYADCDRSKIVEVVQNLLDNAIKYSPDGGNIAITSSPAPGGFVAVSVSDEGAGIHEDDRPGLFDPYERASAAARGLPAGTGLGLYVVRSLVELHHGEVSVESELGRGSAFTFTLPAAQPESAPAQREKAKRATSVRTLLPRQVIPSTGFAIRSLKPELRGTRSTEIA